MIEIKNKKIIIGIIAIFFIIMAIIYYINDNKQEDIIDLIEENTTVNEVEETKIVVHITGEVINPGVVELKEESRVIDAIELAGGFTQNADINKINLAYILEDGQKIYIPKIGEEEKEYITTGIGSSNNEEKTKVNINTATQEQLQQISGIGETLSKNIVAYRKSNGKFKSIDDIKNVTGIGDAKFNTIKEYITV